MHNDDADKKNEHEKDVRTEIEAADDTGLVRQQEIIVESGLGLPVGDDGR
jgi:hypothetical protein